MGAHSANKNERWYCLVTLSVRFGTALSIPHQSAIAVAAHIPID